MTKLIVETQSGSVYEITCKVKDIDPHTMIGGTCRRVRTGPNRQIKGTGMTEGEHRECLFYWPQKGSSLRILTLVEDNKYTQTVTTPVVNVEEQLDFVLN